MGKKLGTKCSNGTAAQDWNGIFANTLATFTDALQRTVNTAENQTAYVLLNLSEAFKVLSNLENK